MKRKLISILVAGATVISPLALAADDAVTVGGATVSGELSIGIRGLKVEATDPSKLKEARDLGSGAIGAFDIRGRGDEGYLNFFGENIGRDDQYIDLRGGKYGTYKYQLYDNQMRHSFGAGLGALTPYGGAGTAVLTSAFPNPDYRSWNTFDESYTRKDQGGMFEFSNNSPWYIRTDVNQVKRQGIKVISAALGTSPGNGFVQLPSPVDFTTQNASIETGYQSKRGHVAASFMYSKFDNGNELLKFSNPYLGTAGIQDTVVLPPDNNLWKLGVNGNLRQLPGNSVLAGRVTYSKLTNDVTVLQSMLANTGSVTGGTGSNLAIFGGKVINQSASLSFTSHPLEKLDTRLYWNWNAKRNESTPIGFAATNVGLAAGTSATGDCGASNRCSPEFFGYRKNNAGAEAGYKINSDNKVSAGIDYLGSDRNRPDFIRSMDRKYYGEWKTSPLETLDARFKYQWMERRSSFVWTTGDIDQYVRRYDLANTDQQLAKITFDLSPKQFLDFGAELIYKQNKYKDTVLGRQSDSRQEYYLSVSMGDPSKFRVMLFGDIELTQYDSLHRVCTTGTPALGDCNPNLAPAATAPNLYSSSYNWSAKNMDRAWQVGLGSDWLPIERLKMNSSLVYAKTNGTTDFTGQSGFSLVGANLGVAKLLPIQNNDNTTRVTLNVKGTYKVSKAWDMTGGYAFERYRFSDIGYDGFSYNTVGSYMTGGGALQNYTAQMVYAVGTFKF